MKILVADDNASVRRILDALLSAWGYDVVTATDGLTAGEILKAEDAPPLAILDWMMPHKDGVEICRELRAHPSQSPPYIILLTCRGQKEDVVAGLDAGADDYITKPFEAEELRARVQVGKRYLELQATLTERMAELRRQGNELRRSNRALTLLNRSSHVIATVATERELLQNMCDAMVDDAGYRLAWVGLSGGPSHTRLVPIAQSGFERGALDAMRIAWSDADPSRSPAGKAMQTGRPAIMRDILNNRQYAHRTVEAATRGFASLAAIPFRVPPDQRGVLNIYAREPEAFDGEELKLLMKLAENLAYGINALRIASERREFEEELQRERDQAQLYLDVAGVLIVALDRRGIITLVNAKGCSILEDSQTALLGKNWFADFAPEGDRAGLIDAYHNLMETGIGFQKYFESSIITTKGMERELAVHASLLRDSNGTITGMLFSGEDITERKHAEKALRSSEENYRTLFDRMVSATSAIAAYRSGSEEQ